MKVQEASKLFSSNHLARLASGDFSFLYRVTDEYLEVEPATISIVDIFEKTYSAINKSYRHEYFYKNTLVNNRLLGRHSLRTAAMITELRVGNNIADCVIFNGSSTCYEIKTEFDSLSRLEAQLDSYLQIFDKTYVVSDSKFLTVLNETLPKNVGIIELNKRGFLSTIREAINLSDKPISVDLIMNSMRATEYMALTDSIYGFVPDVGNIKIYAECRALLERAEPAELRDHFRIVMKSMRANNEKLLTALPRSLKNAAVSYRLPMKLQSKLIDLLNNDGEGRSHVLSDFKRKAI
ncbi:sce7726 family protein [Shewanella putrefaciens]